MTDRDDTEDPFDPDADEEMTREVQLVEDESGFWTVVDSEHGAVGDAPTKAAGLALMEEYLEDMGVDIPDVDPEAPSEKLDRDPKLPPRPDADDSP